MVRRSLPCWWGEAREFHGVLPDAELYAADVYCGAPTGGAVDALAGAFGWMVRERIAVINVSLVGPDNAVLARIVASLTARGYVIVAAVGNDGPAAPPLYPASYPHVVGVTGVDARHRVLLEAARGAQVMFAAPGADMAAGAPAGTYVAVRGTSFAAPIVAALLAQRLSRARRRASLGGGAGAGASCDRSGSARQGFDIWLWSAGRRICDRSQASDGKPLKGRSGEERAAGWRNGPQRGDRPARRKSFWRRPGRKRRGPSYH